MQEVFRLRWLGVLEGLTLLGLLGITMPLKYLYQIPTPNKILGLVHGFLFVIYLVYLFQVKEKRNWSYKKFFILVILSSIPFGFVISEIRKEWND